MVKQVIAIREILQNELKLVIVRKGFFNIRLHVWVTNLLYFFYLRENCKKVIKLRVHLLKVRMAQHGIGSLFAYHSIKINPSEEMIPDLRRDNL